MSFPPPFYRWRPHPWHGLETGLEPPGRVCAYIEITPFDLVKYEIDKATGYTRVDRPQRSSSQPPALYGFIPQTYCGARVGKLSSTASGGDGDPLDICVISERPINRADVILNTRVVGGIRAVDDDEADDKIIAVLENDNVYGKAGGLDALPSVMIERLRHYFGTYKLRPGEPNQMKIVDIYDRDEALKVVQAAMDDYVDEYGG